MTRIRARAQVANSRTFQLDDQPVAEHLSFAKGNQTMLPDKLSDLITVALADLAQVEALPKIYTVDMDVFHRPEHGRCHVCLAGAVMARSLNYPPDQRVATGQTGYPHHLAALDSARVGCVNWALRDLGQTVRNDLNAIITPYSISPTQFRADMTQLATNLQAAGL